MTPLLLVGGGGHCRSCIDVIESTKSFKIVGIIDQKDNVGKDVLGYPVVGCDGDLAHWLGRVGQALITIGQIKSPEPRQRLARLCAEAGYRFPTVVSPHAVVSKHASLGAGTIVHHGAMVNAGAKVGDHNILNSQSLVEHDAALENYVHISTGAIVNGGVKVGEGAFLGSGSTTREYIEIPKGAVIPAGTAYMSGQRGDP